MKILAVLLMAPVAFLYYLSVLVVPGPWMPLMLALFVLEAGLLVVLVRRGSSWSLTVPLAAVAVWFAVVSAGDAFLGWTA